MTELGEVDSDLVRSSGLETTGDERSGVREDLSPLEMRDRVLRSVTAPGELQSIAWVSSVSRADRSFRFVRDTSYEREIAAADGVIVELLCESFVGDSGLADDDQPCRVFVESMHDTGPKRLSTAELAV